MPLGLLTQPVEVESITTADYPTPARRPAYSVLDRGSAERGLGPQARPLAGQSAEDAEGVARMRNVLITGGAGFIGANFVHHWLAKHPADRVMVLDALTYAGSRLNLAGLEGRRRLPLRARRHLRRERW